MLDSLIFSVYPDPFIISVVDVVHCHPPVFHSDIEDLRLTEPSIAAFHNLAIQHKKLSGNDFRRC